ncbi:HipA family kinase [Arsukibacterium indicum]|uniref:HipA-like kinase domain-containing protein n=1 Tax=Arsukibacterium indicum TaxID=2848612 RepID=A0ABS6MGL9_9GAMM|nr:HipA family kinase [Arsukibacterium indicum]MBV2127949.1 hypothetical protein [Arsukibacterium indicum]
MLQIGFATLYTTPRKITNLGNICPLWLGDAVTNNGDARLYLKEVTYQELIAECLCTTVGSVIGLPVLQTYVVRDPQNLLNAKYLLGSEDAEMPSFKRHLSLADKSQQKELLAALVTWRQLHESAVFDEWIGNSDRNTGNFLWDGGNQWHLIDHGRALWTTRTADDPAEPFQNILADIIKGIYQEIGIAQLKKTMVGELVKYQEVDTTKVLLASRCSELGCVAEAQSKLISLVSRINSMPALIARHSDQQELF